MYTSPEIQNSLLHIMGDMVRKMICDSVQQAGFFTLMADESKDCSKIEQFSIVFRYADVDTGIIIYERFLTYTVEPPITDPPRSGQPLYSGQKLCYGLKLL